MVKHKKIKPRDSNSDNDNPYNESHFVKKSNESIVMLIFALGFSIIILSVSSVIFPGLLLSISDGSEFLNPFEVNPIGITLIIISIVVIIVIILNSKQSLPKTFVESVKKIQEYDLSKRNSLVFLIIILGIYISISVSELSINEVNQYGDILIVEEALRIWPDGKSENVYVTEQLTRHVRIALLAVSDEVFDNIKIIPYLASIFLIITTYFLTIRLSQKNFAGLIAVVILLQSSTFLTYDTIAVYENFWALFYVFSIYLIFQQPKLSSISYLLSIFSKAITVLMLPITIIVTLLSDIPRSKKVFVIITHIIILLVSIGIFQISNTIYGDVIDINVSEFLIGFSTLAFNLRFDVFLLLFLLPVSIGLFLKARNGDKNSISLMVLMCGTILVTPVLEMLTNFYFVYPYRYIPLLVFFAISIGSMFSKR